MTVLVQVPVASLRLDRFRDVIGPERHAAVEQAVERARRLLAGRIVWNLNSTARGGGVAEMLRWFLAYGRGAGIDTRWLVIHGDSAFFRLTKDIHNRLHGYPVGDTELGAADHELYERVLARNAAELSVLVRPGDVVVLHDPQTAGLVPAAAAAGAVVIWRCHVELALGRESAGRAWQFLLPYLQGAHAYVFSRRYAAEGLDEEKIAVIAPSIDPFSPKNQELPPETVSAMLNAAGLASASAQRAAPVFTREDGSPGTVTRRALLHCDAGPVPADVPLVLQVSRWDRLKDPAGVIEGFARNIDPSAAHLMVAGPSVDSVSDDPEGAQVLEEIKAVWADLPSRTKPAVHLACLPMEDGEENAAIVNALQRRATVVVQKSLAEGFGLTVAEAMWKGRPVVASRIGGIQEQIVDGESGLLVDDPHDLDAFGLAVRRLLSDPEEAERIGSTGRERVRDQFLGTRHLMQYVDLIESLLH
jgi:trehalose synthase